VAEIPAGAAGIVAGAHSLGVTLDAEQAQRLAAFAEQLSHWNRAFNLISRRDVGRLLPRHLLDSLSAGPWLAGDHVMDLGTGAGLPGVPLAIAYPERRFTLVDRNARRIRFVSHACRTLSIANVEALACDVAGLPAGRRFDTIVARAVADVTAVWRLGQPLLRRGGRMLVLWRGQSASAAAAEVDSLQEPLPGLARLDHHEIRIPGLDRPHRLAVLEGEDGAG
jgi:16S rRNA (guanine527-N7)-methyltransferase